MFLFKWLIMTVAIFVTAKILPGITVDGITTALVVALLLGLVNIFFRPLLILLTFPITVLTLGFFLLIINALLLYFVAWMVTGFAIHGFFWALLGSIFITIVSTLLSVVLKKR